jgi:homoserine dehydrogenase
LVVILFFNKILVFIFLLLFSSDVGRKVVICGRLIGLDLDLESLPVENIVPEALRQVPSGDEFLAQLAASDDHFQALNQQAFAEGNVSDF